MIVLRNGQPRFVIGGAGGHRIVSAITEVLSRLVDEEMDLVQAMAAPRLNPLSDTLYLETDDEALWTNADLATLRGFGLRAGPRDASYFARVNAIAIDPVTGAYTGVADPRWGGGAGAPRRR
jgi:gamma-glutamyltranspeptidase/glutathione hydrolase